MRPIKCPECVNGGVEIIEGDQSKGFEMCEECNGSGEITLVQWAILNGWESNGIGGAETDGSHGWHELDEDGTVYWIDLDFDRHVEIKNATPEQIINLIKADQ